MRVLLLALAVLVGTANASDRIGHELLRAEHTTLAAPQWQRLTKMYKFTNPEPLEAIFPHNAPRGFSLSSTMYGTEDNAIFPSYFVIYKNTYPVAILGMDEQFDQAISPDYPFPVVYTQYGARLPKNEKIDLEQWFQQWISTVN